jgi:hypothetical protein
MTVTHARCTAAVSFALRLLLPVLIIYLLPAEEAFFQHIFQSEGILRILLSAWAFRSSLLLSLKKAGLCGLVFGLEEVLQEICLYFLI